MKKDKAIKLLLNSSKEYEANLNNKDFLIIYEKNKEFKYVVVSFKDNNYLHLTGVQYKKGSAKQFYDECIHNKLSIHSIEYKKDGTTELKLSVLSKLGGLLYQAVQFGEYNGIGIQLNSEIIIGDTKKVISLGFQGEGKKFPNTLLKKSITELTTKTYKVVLILMKKSSMVQFERHTYLHKDYTIDEVINETNFDQWIINYNGILDYIPLEEVITLKEEKQIQR